MAKQKAPKKPAPKGKGKGGMMPMHDEKTMPMKGGKKKMKGC